MKITAALLFIFTGFFLSFAHAENYLVTFSLNKDFSQFHKMWLSGNFDLIRKSYFSKVDSSFKIKYSLEKVHVVIIESQDPLFTQKASSQGRLSIEKETYFKSTRHKKSIYKKDPADFLSKLLTPNLTNIVGNSSINNTSSNLSNYTKNLIGWGPKSLKVKEAWNLGHKGEGVRIADVDADIDVTHPALYGKIEAVQDFLGDQDARDFGHGTQVGGVMVGSENQDGFYGIAPNAKLLTVTACGIELCPAASVAQAINWAISEKVDIIHMPLSTDEGETPAMNTALEAADAAGIAVVASAGNDADEGKENVINYPARFRTVISVGGLMPDLTRIYWSQWSPELTLVGPGFGIYTSVQVGTGCDAFMDLAIDNTVVPVDVACYQQTAHVENGLSNEIVYVGNASNESLVNLDLYGKILLTDSTVSVNDAFHNTYKSHPAAIIHINSNDSLRSYVVRDSHGNPYPIPMINMKAKDGKMIIDALTLKKSVSVKLKVNRLDYGTQAGTSVSAPMIAGIIALMKSANPKISLSQIKSILKNTATSLEPACEGRCGAGIPNAEKAVEAALSAGY